MPEVRGLKVHRRVRAVCSLAVCLVLLLAGCAAQVTRPRADLPPLRLAPWALGHELAVQQQLRFHLGSHSRTLDAMLEVDAHQVRLLVQAMGQAGVRVFWDGHRLQQQRADWLPAAVRAERVLDDLQFALWPLAEIRAVLPQAWSVREVGPVRELLHDGIPWLVVTYVDQAHLHLLNRAEGYVLEIESIDRCAPATDAAQP